MHGLREGGGRTPIACTEQPDGNRRRDTREKTLQVPQYNLLTTDRNQAHAHTHEGQRILMGGTLSGAPR